MHVALSPNLVGIHPPLSILGSMISKGAGSKETNGNSTGAVVERVSIIMFIYEDTKLIMDKDIKLKWQEVNDVFVGIFGEYLEDYQVYVNIHEFSL